MAQFTRYTGTLTGANGTLITALDAALVTGQGWDNTFAGGGANKKIYRPAAGNQFYFRVRDDSGGTGGAKEALIRGAESWTDIDTPNLNPFPSAAQSALTDNSLVIRKSATTDGTTHAYVIYADDRTAIIFIKSEATTHYYGPYYLGDFFSLNSAADGYRTCLMGRNAENTNATTAEPLGTVGLAASINSYSATLGHFMARNYLGAGTSATIQRLSDAKIQNTNALTGLLTVPNGPDGGIYISRQHLFEQTSAIIQYRGRLRGMWAWCHLTMPYADADTFSGVNELAGKTYQIVNPISAAGAVATWCIETSNTLETN